MPSLPDPEEQGALLQGILRKIPSIHDPDHLQELVVLALELVLQRPEDHAKKEALVKSVRASIDAVRQETVPSKFFAAMKDAAHHCVTVLQAARNDSLSRDVPHQRPQEIPEEKPEPEDPGEHPGRDTPPTPWSVVALTISLVTASAAAMIAIATHAIWQDSPYAKRPNILTAAQFASELAEAASSSPGTPPWSDARIKLHQVRGADDRMILVVETIPRRICPASGWILARKGLLTINGTVPATVSKSAITALCYRSKDDPKITWSPNPS